MTRRANKKVIQKRIQPTVEPRRPAGIQAMDWRLYQRIQQAIRGMDCR